MACCYRIIIYIKVRVSTISIDKSNRIDELGLINYCCEMDRTTMDRSNSRWTLYCCVHMTCLYE